jgi:hypothetical protein
VLLAELDKRAVVAALMEARAFATGARPFLERA